MLITAVLQVLGTIIILFTLRDVFHDIFHPTRSGSLSDFIGRLGLKFFARSKVRPAIGPASLVAVMVCWVILISVGFALLYFSLIPSDITGHSTAGASDKVFPSLYLSFGSIATFQTFDIDLHRDWLKLLVAIQGLIGISLITASVSWLVLLYPALERTRFLANKTFTLIEAMERGKVASLRSDTLLTEMADRVLQARIDLILFPILLNFYPSDRSQTLALALPHLQRLAEGVMQVDAPDSLRLGGLQLLVALEKFAQMLRERVVSTTSDDIATVFHEFAHREG